MQVAGLEAGLAVERAMEQRVLVRPGDDVAELAQLHLAQSLTRHGLQDGVPVADRVHRGGHFSEHRGRCGMLPSPQTRRRRASRLRVPACADASLPTVGTCLLYTSDAADDLTRVDLGGRRIIKK